MAVYTHNEIPGSPTAVWSSVLVASTPSTDLTTFANFTNSDGTISRLHGSGGSVTSADRASDAAGTVIYETVTGFSISVLSVFLAGSFTLDDLFAGADTFNGWSGVDFMTSFGGADVLNGNGGNDILDGGTGADIMNGGTGDDTFLVDDIGDIIGENPGEGIDTAIASLATYSIAAFANVENLTGNEFGQRTDGQ